MDRGACVCHILWFVCMCVWVVLTRPGVTRHEPRTPPRSSQKHTNTPNIHSYLRACKSISNRATKSCWHPDNVVRALVRAATASNPRTQYIVGGDAKFLLLPLLNLPAPLVEDLIYAVVYMRLVPACLRDRPPPQQQQGQQAAAVAPAALAPAAAPKEEKEGKSEEEKKVPLAG